MFWAKELNAGSVRQAKGPGLPDEVMKAVAALMARPKADRTAEGRLLHFTELDPLYAQMQQAVVRLLKKVQTTTRPASNV